MTFITINQTGQGGLPHDGTLQQVRGRPRGQQPRAPEHDTREQGRGTQGLKRGRRGQGDGAGGHSVP